MSFLLFLATISVALKCIYRVGLVHILSFFYHLCIIYINNILYLPKMSHFSVKNLFKNLFSLISW
jgi:hypothetical protein